MLDSTTGGFWDGATDTVSSLFDSYLKFRAVENQADVVGAGQTQLNTQVEQPQGNGQVPLSANQLGAASGSASGGMMGLSKNQMLIGAGLLAVVLLVKR